MNGHLSQTVDKTNLSRRFGARIYVFSVRKVLTGSGDYLIQQPKMPIAPHPVMGEWGFSRSASYEVEHKALGLSEFLEIPPSPSISLGLP
jgi:hypothetical protein